VKSSALKLLIVAGLACLPSAAGQAQPVKALASADSSRYLIGDWIRVTVELRHPRGTTFQPAIPDSLAGFTVLQRLPFASMSDTVTRTGVIIARYDSASAVIPGLTYLSAVPGDTALHPVSTNTVALTVQRVRVDSAGQARDIKPVMSIPYTLAEILMFVGALLVLAAGAYVAYRFYAKRRQKAVVDTRLPVLKAAHVVAYEHLAMLKEKRLWQQGKVKEYHSELTEILRRYLEDRFGMMALEETTGEILDGLSRMKLLPKIIRDVEDVLVRADLVKFAKHKPEIGEHDASLKSVYDVVERTKAALSPPVHSGQSAAGHVVPPGTGEPAPSTQRQPAPVTPGRTPGPVADKEGAHVGS
jgi:hypothetical protein